MQIWIYSAILHIVQNLFKLHYSSPIWTLCKFFLIFNLDRAGLLYYLHSMILKFLFGNFSTLHRYSRTYCAIRQDKYPSYRITNYYNQILFHLRPLYIYWHMYSDIFRLVSWHTVSHHDIFASEHFHIFSHILCDTSF